MAPEAALRALQEQRANHEQRLSAFEEIRRSFPEHALPEIPDEQLGAYLTPECAIATQEAFAAWSARAESPLKLRANVRG